MASTSLPAVIHQCLAAESITLYRLQYRAYRLGEPEGAKGEVRQFSTAGGAAGPVQAVDEALLRDETFFSGSKTDAVFDAISQYRISYLRFRAGSSRGAKGEISSVSQLMSLDHARMMPVGQLSTILKAKKAAPETVPRELTSFHVHIGGGRLGLGLLSPAIAASKRSFAIVDGPFGDYERLAAPQGPEAVNFHVNGLPTLENVKVITSKDQLPSDLTAPGVKLFVCSTDKELVGHVLSQATSVSTSLGPVLERVVMPHFEKELPLEERKPLYCCENDHNMVEELKAKLGNRAIVVPCMVDRICTGREVTTASVPDILVTAEPYTGSCVILNAPRWLPLPAFGGENIKAPETEAAATYFCRRKIICVNGMHTVLAFMTLCRRIPTGDLGDGETWKDFDLTTHATATEEERRMIKMWTTARCLFLLWEFDLQVIMAAHGVETESEVCQILLDYAAGTVSRFDTVHDKAGRVLGGGVTNRWEGRLRMIKDYLDEEPAMKKGVRKRLLDMAGVSEKAVRDAVAELVNGSRRFAGI